MKKMLSARLRKRVISLLLVVCMLVALTPAVTMEAEASVGAVLKAALTVGKSVVSGAITTAEHSDYYENSSVGEIMLATWKNMAADLTGLDIGDKYDDDEDDEGTAADTDHNVYINNVDLSGVEEQLKAINDALEKHSVAIHQLEATIVTDMTKLSDQIDALSKKIDSQTQILQYDTYLDTFFEFFNQYLEAISYYDNKMTYVLSGKATDTYIKKTYDQFYELEGREYTGNLHSAVDKLGRYIRGEYMSQYSSGIVDILSKYYIVGYENSGYSTEAARKLAAENLESIISYVYYAYCMGVYYESTVSTYQLFYMRDNDAADYSVGSSEMLIEDEINDTVFGLLNDVQPTVGCIVYDLYNNYENESVPYTRSSASWLGTYYADIDGFTVDICETVDNLRVNLYLPDPCNYISSAFSDEFRQSFAGVLEYAQEAPQSDPYGYNTMTVYDGNIISIDKDISAKQCTLDLIAGDRVIRAIPITMDFANSANAKGDGSKDNPYRIYGIDDIKNISNAPDAYYTLANDVDCGGETLAPIENFSGCIYGNGYTISNFVIDLNSPSNAASGYHAVGFVGVLTGTVSNLRFSDVTVANNESKDNYAKLCDDTYSVGIIAGLVCGGRIEYCSIADDTSTILIGSSTNTFVGGMAGCLLGGGEIYASDAHSLALTSIVTVLGKTNEAGAVVGRIGSGESVTVGGKTISAKDNTGSVDLIYVNGEDNVFAVAKTWSLNRVVEPNGAVSLYYTNAEETTSSGMIAGNVVNGKVTDSVIAYSALSLTNTEYIDTGFDGYLSTATDNAELRDWTRFGKYGIIAGRCGNDGSISSNAVYGSASDDYELVGEGSAADTLSYASGGTSVSDAYDKILKQPDGSANPFAYNGEDNSIALDRGICIVGDLKTEYTMDEAYCRFGQYNGLGYDCLFWNLSGMAMYYYVGEGNIVAPVKCAHIAESDDSHTAYRELTRSFRLSEGDRSEKRLSYSSSFTFYDRSSDDENNSVTIDLSAHISHKYMECYVPSSTPCGVSEHYYMCAVCGRQVDRTISSTPHDHTIVEGYPATCTEDGLTDEDHCSKCGRVHTAATVIPATGHSWETVTLLEATCTTGGVLIEKCSECGAYGDMQTVLPHGHDYVASHVSANCGELGYTVYTCTVCGSTYTSDFKDTVCPSAYFADVPARGHWSHEGIDYMLRLGLFIGMSDTTFEPETSVTRAMLVTVLYRYEGKPAVTGENVFTDVDENMWYADAVLWASENGIVLGMGDGTFEPDTEITREQMAVMLYRYAVYKGYDVSTRGDYSAFPDAESVNDWAEEALSWAYGTGLVNGTTVDKVTYLDPQGSATRAQACVMFMRYIENIVP